MFEKLISGPRPWLYAHIFLEGGVANLDNPSYALEPGSRAALNGTGAYASLDDLGDVGDDYDASLVEQELCAGAAAFVGTADSSWTGLVAQERFAAGRCGTAFEHLLRTKKPRRRGARPADLVAGALLAPSLAALDCA